MARHRNFINYDGKQFQEIVVKSLSASGAWYVCSKGHRYCVKGQHDGKCTECASLKEEMGV